MRITDRLKNLIKRGLEGKNKGISTGIPKLDATTDGIQRGLYTLLFGPTGSGKTSVALYSYIFRPLMDNANMKIVYYSLEMTAELLFAKLLSLYIYEKFQIKLSYKKILSKQEILDIRAIQYVEEGLIWLESIEDRFIIYDKSLNAESLEKHLGSVMSGLGTFEKKEDTIIYTPKDPDMLVQVIIDHIALLRRASGRSKKEEIDLASNYLVTYRNVCGISPLVLMQMNRQASSMDRRSGGYQEPQLDDIKDSGGPSEDAEQVIAVFYPQREKMAVYNHYKIAVSRDGRGFGKKFRALVCLKNRYGDCDVSIGCSFHGEIGMLRELPKGEEIQNITDYTPYTELPSNNHLIEDNLEDIDVEEEEDIISNYQAQYNF